MSKIKDFFTAFIKWFNFKDKAKLALIISLCLVIVGGLLASMIQTNFFTVQVYSQTLEVTPYDLETSTDAAKVAYDKTKKPAKVAADIYRPSYASEENKVPLVFVVPGIQRTKETQASFCIELVRRGFAVICIDPLGQGDSTSSYEKQSATKEGYGLFYWMDYLFEDDKITLKDEFAYVDATKIGACGHSAGGNACQKLAEREGKLEKDYGIKRLNAVYITGYIREWTFTNTRCNIGISYSYNDEGAFQNATATKKNSILDKQAKGETLTAEEEWWLTVGNADLRYAEESLEIVNYQLNREGLASVSEVEIGVDYGNPYKYTYAVINNESALHALQPYDADTLANLSRFFDYVFESEHGLDPYNHIWWLKEAGCGLMLVGAFAFICALFVLLLRTKFFSSLKHEIPKRTGDQKVKGRIFFWIAFVVSAVIAALLYMACVGWSVEWFPEAAGSRQTWFFPQRFTNAVMLWAVFNGLIGVVIFFITWGAEWLIDHFKARKVVKVTDVTNEVVEDGAEVDSNARLLEIEEVSVKRQEIKKEYLSKLEPMKIGWAELGKTLLMATILICSFFALDYLGYFIFHADMRLLFISARVSFSWQSILAIAMYIPFFLIFYISNSFRVNCSMRPQNWPEWLSQLIAVLGNTLGLVALVLIEYIPMITTGTIGFTNTVGPQWLFINLLFSIIPLMIALPLFNRFFFNKTGRAWLGPIVICVIFICMTGASTTIYYLI